MGMPAAALRLIIQQIDVNIRFVCWQLARKELTNINLNRCTCCLAHNHSSVRWLRHNHFGCGSALTTKNYHAWDSVSNLGDVTTFAASDHLIVTLAEEFRYC